MQQQQRQGAYAPAGLRMPGAAPARRDDFQEADHLRSPSVSTASYEQSPRTPAVAFRPGTVMSSWGAGKDADQPRPEDYYYPVYGPSDHQQPAALVNGYDPYFHQAQPVIPPRAYAPPPQNYGYEPGQYYAPADPAAYAPTQEYHYDYVQQPAPASYYQPTGAQYAQHPRGNEAQYPYNASIGYAQPAPTRQSQQASALRTPQLDSNALQLQTAAPARTVQPAAPAHSPAASESSEPDGEFEYVSDCPDCGTSFLSLRALHAHLFIQYRRGWCPGVP